MKKYIHEICIIKNLILLLKELPQDLLNRRNLCKKAIMT